DMLLLLVADGFALKVRSCRTPVRVGCGSNDRARSDGGSVQTGNGKSATRTGQLPASTPVVLGEQVQGVQQPADRHHHGTHLVRCGLGGTPVGSRVPAGGRRWFHGSPSRLGQELFCCLCVSSRTSGVW